MSPAAPVWLRRARPMLGTLVEIGVGGAGAIEQAALAAAFAAVQRVQACMSRFESGSDVCRFAALAPGGGLEVAPETAAVLQAAHELRLASRGLFDITQGRAPDGWRCEGLYLRKLAAAAAFDLGGIAKGYAVDCAVQILQQAGCTQGWVNAGGDLRAFGAVQVPVMLRDEASGAARPFLALGDGALATSCLGPQQRSQIWAGNGAHASAHVSVAAPLCLWADALTKIVAASGDDGHPLLAHYGARAWLHAGA
ncbi:FAD:protein FMN transferase [Comamonas guangdongensis]|uniref:FAD:protein FMN transferase n=1 Tax=Comamonas guangdongensis TaxID=510515 RepID=A0ABV4A211_9BURK